MSPRPRRTPALRIDTSVAQLKPSAFRIPNERTASPPRPASTMPLFTNTMARYLARNPTARALFIARNSLLVGNQYFDQALATVERFAEYVKAESEDSEDSEEEEEADASPLRDISGLRKRAQVVTLRPELALRPSIASFEMTEGFVTQSDGPNKEDGKAPKLDVIQPQKTRNEGRQEAATDEKMAETLTHLSISSHPALFATLQLAQAAEEEAEAQAEVLVTRPEERENWEVK